MSPKRATTAPSGKRVPYRAPRDRREVWTAIAAACLIVVVTASFVWFLRPNREGSPTPATNPDVNINTIPTTPPTAPADSTAPADTAPTEDTTAPAGG